MFEERNHRNALEDSLFLISCLNASIFQPFYFFDQCREGLAILDFPSILIHSSNLHDLTIDDLQWTNPSGGIMRAS